MCTCTSLAIPIESKELFEEEEQVTFENIGFLFKFDKIDRVEKPEKSEKLTIQA